MHCLHRTLDAQHPKDRGRPSPTAADSDSDCSVRPPDTARYASGSNDVRVASIDGVASDGYTGEADRIDLTVENLTGTAFKDALVGSTAPNTLNGGVRRHRNRRRMR